MSQIVVNDAPAVAFEGMLHDRPELIKSGLAAAVVYFGKALSQLKTDLSLPPVVRMYTAGEVFAGIAVAETTLERVDGAPAGEFVQGGAVQRLMKGRIWVKSADAIDDLTKSVFVRSANPGVTPPAESLGSFRATAATDYTDLGAIANVKWIAAVTIGTDNFGLLAVNEG